jgi:RNA binding exosome subunit
VPHLPRQDLQFKSVEVSYFLHATEDYDRVITAIAKVLHIQSESFTSSEAQGHYGNPIKVVRAHLIGKEAVDFVRVLFESFSSVQKQEMFANIDRSLNEHGDLFIRLDKQRLLSGKLVSSDIDPVRIKIKLRFNIGRDSILQAYQALLKD